MPLVTVAVPEPDLTIVSTIEKRGCTNRKYISVKSFTDQSRGRGGGVKSFGQHPC